MMKRDVIENECLVVTSEMCDIDNSFIHGLEARVIFKMGKGVDDDIKPKSMYKC